MAQVATFKTSSEAKAVGAALFAAGKVTGWTDYRQFGKFVVRIQKNGRWFNLLNADLVA